MGKPKVRVPALEEFSLLLQNSFVISSRFLNAQERKILLDIFGLSVNLDPVQIEWVSLGVKGRPYTLGNSIRIPRATNFYMSTLVHEMTHVWQYQTHGAGYISDSALHQLVQGQGVYNFNLVPGQSFGDYTAEQQAKIVEKYYTDDPPGWRTDPDVVRMIAEVQKARPLAASEIERDIWQGPSFNNPPADPNAPQLTPTVPLFRVDW